MSLMSLGYKMVALKHGVDTKKYTTRDQVLNAAKEMNVAVSIGYDSLSQEDKNLWYEQLAVNLFDNHNNWIPCFVDLGFGKELLDHSSGIRNNNIPQKQHWKIIVKREKFLDWQFNAIVHSYTREEAINILKVFFGDFGDIGFKYEDSTPKTEHKVTWVEINSKKNQIKSYKEYLLHN